MNHVPVLMKEVIQNCSELSRVENYLDCTFGRGGHYREILHLFPDMKTDAIDQDVQAIDYAKEYFNNEKAFRIHHCNFMEPNSWPQNNFFSTSFDLILADLGVSSPQLDLAERGFSFYKDGPLDMRMNQKQEESAKDIINTYEEEGLVDLFRELGEVRSPYRAVKAIVKRRSEQAIDSTKDLAEIIAKAEGWRKKKVHPATKYFLAIRMKVNKEIELLDSGLDNLISLLRPSGRLLVISFHSSEDRIVKWNFKKNKEYGKILTKKVIAPSRDEILNNPRSRSAKLRVFEKGVVSES